MYAVAEAASPPQLVVPYSIAIRLEMVIGPWTLTRVFMRPPFQSADAKFPVASLAASTVTATGSIVLFCFVIIGAMIS